ncbi:MAG: hypothetical protein IPM82_32375 [Saprospiraceae bacterium]|nr:hypothetical protein [Saprospiraceae bacterium]
MRKYFQSLALPCLLLAACTSEQVPKKHLIGFIQCCANTWREVMKGTN